MSKRSMQVYGRGGARVITGANAPGRFIHMVIVSIRIERKDDLLTTEYRTQLQPDATAALRFVEALYECTPEQGWLTLFHVDKTSGDRATLWVPLDDLARVCQAVETLATRGDLYFGVAPRREVLRDGRRGGVTDCLSIPAFWLDVDIACEQHKTPGLPTSYEQARQLIERFRLAPSLVVRSGYGFQVYWRLSEPLSALEALELLPRWRATWQALAGAQGCHVDNVTNLDRLMRLPGSYNFKGTEPVPVTYRAAR